MLVLRVSGYLYYNEMRKLFLPKSPLSLAQVVAEKDFNDLPDPPQLLGKEKIDKIKALNKLSKDLGFIKQNYKVKSSCGFGVDLQEDSFYVNSIRKTVWAEGVFTGHQPLRMQLVNPDNSSQVFKALCLVFEEVVTPPIAPQVDSLQLYLPVLAIESMRNITIN